MNSNKHKFDHSLFDELFGDNIDRESLDQPIGTDKVNASDLPQAEEPDEYETITVSEFDTELGYITETVKVKKENEVSDNISKGDFVTVKPHTVYQHLSGGAVINPAKAHQHNGYRRVRVHNLFDDGLGSVTVEIEIGDMVDEVPLEYCEKL